MCPRQVVFFVLCYLSCSFCKPERVFLQNNGCDDTENKPTGFTCIPIDGTKKKVIFECPDESKEYLFYTNEFNGPASIDSLIIKNCKSLTVSFKCSTSPNENRDLKYLEVSNIDNLKIVDPSFQSTILPATVVFENITTIEDIPKATFVEAPEPRDGTACRLPTKKFDSLLFRNVSISTIQERGFYLLNDFGNVSFINVTLGELDLSSFVVTQRKDSRFLIENSTFGNVDFLTFQIRSGSVNLSQNNFGNITSRAIQITCDTFIFENNTVYSLDSRGLSVESEDILFSSNDFLYFNTGALAETGTSDDAYSRTNATYVFKQNNIIVLDEDSLLPYLDHYGNISRQVIFRDNAFFCDLYQTEWPISPTGKSTIRELFHRQLFAKEFNNACAYVDLIPSEVTDVRVIEEYGFNTGNPSVSSYFLTILLLKVQIYVFSHYLL